MAHSAKSKTALAMNMPGTNLAGEMCRRAFELMPTSATEKADVSTTIKGRDVTSRLAR
jgi:hypothetical protein